MWSLVGTIAGKVAGAVVTAALAPFVAAWKTFQNIRQGQQQQKAADDAASVKEDQHASEIDESVSALGDAELDAELRKPNADSQ